MCFYTIRQLEVENNAIEAITGEDGIWDALFTDSNELPTTGAAMLDSVYRSNNTIVKSFGNSLYDNLIINDTSPSGYGFWNLVGRTFDWEGFQWYISDQNAWDALQEVALFMGDYIVTTLPLMRVVTCLDINLERPYTLDLGLVYIKLLMEIEQEISYILVRYFQK